MSGAPHAAAGSVAELTDPLSMSFIGAGQVSELLRHLSEGPQLADAGGPERTAAKTTQLRLAVQKSTRAYESVMAAAWAETNTRFAEAVSQRYRDTNETPTAKEALRHWLDIANQVLLETQRSEKFLGAQRQLLRGGMDFMLNQREVLESTFGPVGLPTRSERLIESSKSAGRVALEAYENALQSMLDFQTQVADASQLDWVSALATAHAQYIKDVSAAYVKAVRENLR